MAYDRPSWRDIDKMRDQPGGRKRRKKEEKDTREPSTRYDKYKADLNRLFDQGMAGELLKKMGKEAESAPETAPGPKPAARPAKAKAAVTTRKSSGRIPKSTRASTSRLRLIRTIIDTTEHAKLLHAVEDLAERFGLPDDWEVLVRVLEHDDESLVLQSVLKMKNLLAVTAKVPRRATLKERLRSIGQTATNPELRDIAAELEEKL